MLRRLLLAFTLILLIGPLGLLADTEKPTVAFLRYGGNIADVIGGKRHSRHA